MATRSDEFRREALALPDAERADLAAELLVSLEAPTDEEPSQVRSLWGAEIERRARRVIAGDTKSLDWKIVRQRLADAPGFATPFAPGMSGFENGIRSHGPRHDCERADTHGTVPMGCVRR